jgi:hypothetical protein
VEQGDDYDALFTREEEAKQGQPKIMEGEEEHEEDPREEHWKKHGPLNPTERD